MARDWLLACLALGAIELAFALRFRLALRRERLAPPSAYAPAVSVIVPCRGAGPGLAENARSLLAQRYAGEIEHLFVTPSADDPAHAVLSRVLSEAGGPRARVLVSGAVPVRCSEKALNLLAGVAGASPDSEVLLFADGDVRVRPDWIRRMVAPLAEPAVGVATAVMLYLPPSPNLASALRLAWMAAGLPYFEPMGDAAGQSLAVRRRDFESLGIARLWESSLEDDLSLARRFREAGKTVRLAATATPLSTEPCTLSGMLRLFNRWMTVFRVYDARVWGLGAAVTALKWAILARALQPPVDWPLLSALAGADMAAVAVVLEGLRRHVPEIFAQAGAEDGRAVAAAVLAAPGLWLVHAVNFLCSALSDEVRWSGYTYRLRGPQRVEVLSAPPSGAAREDR